MQPPATSPQNPSAPARATSWVRTRSRPVQIGLGCAALIILCICGTSVLVLAAGGGSPSTANTSPGATVTATATATATHRSAGPTATATATATAPHAAPATLTSRGGGSGNGSGPALLGGSGQAFIDKYGPLTSQSDTSTGDLHFRQYAGVAQDFLIVDLGVRLGITPGGQNAATILVSAPPGQSWTTSQADASCAAFFPSDAGRVKSVPVTNSSGVIGVDVVYHSDALTRVFPASAFVDASQNPATPGSFDVMYLYTTPNSSGQIDDCQIALGTQQTAA
jgi:hypothetical protein